MLIEKHHISRMQCERDLLFRTHGAVVLPAQKLFLHPQTTWRISLQMATFASTLTWLHRRFHSTPLSVQTCLPRPGPDTHAPHTNLMARGFWSLRWPKLAFITWGVSSSIATNMNTRDEFRNVSVMVTVGVVEVGVVDTLRCQPARSRRWVVEVRVFTHAQVSMITYHVDVYRSRPIGASLLTTSPQQGCLALKGLNTGWLGAVMGIRLIQIWTGGFLVNCIVRLTKLHHSQHESCLSTLLSHNAALLSSSSWPFVII